MADFPGELICVVVFGMFSTKDPKSRCRVGLIPLALAVRSGCRAGCASCGCHTAPADCMQTWCVNISPTKRL